MYISDYTFHGIYTGHITRHMYISEFRLHMRFMIQVNTDFSCYISYWYGFTYHVDTVCMHPVSATLKCIVADSVSYLQRSSARQCLLSATVESATLKCVVADSVSYHDPCCTCVSCYTSYYTCMHLLPLLPHALGASLWGA